HNLEPVSLPVRDLEVQIAVFAGATLTVDPESGDPVCPDVHYSASNGFPFPFEHDVLPVLGGRAYYHPGDSEVRVVLGCTDLSAMQSGLSCTRSEQGKLTAKVLDFESRVPVSGGPNGVADHLFVSVGEPHAFDGGFVLNPADAIALHLDGQEMPAWSAPGWQMFSQYACVEVLEDVPQAVATLRCIQASPSLPRLEGMRVLKNRVQTVLTSLGMPPSEFPSEGLTIGIVLDAQYNTAEN